MMAQTLSPGTEVAFYEINLIGNRVDRLRRRQVLSHVGDVASVFMLTVAVVLCLIAVMNLWNIMSLKLKMRSVAHKLQLEEELCAELDGLRTKTMEQVGLLPKLVPAAERRIPWAPKLAAMAMALPRGMGIEKIYAESGELFPPPGSGAQNERGASSKKNVARMVFSVVYLPSAGQSEDPMGQLRGNLQEAEAFMDKMESVNLEATAEETWDNVPVQSFRGLLKGVASENET